MENLCKFYFNFFLHDIVEVFKESTAVVTASARVDVYSYILAAHGKYLKNLHPGVLNESEKKTQMNECLLDESQTPALYHH